MPADASNDGTPSRQGTIDLQDRNERYSQPLSAFGGETSPAFWESYNRSVSRRLLTAAFAAAMASGFVPPRRCGW